MRILTPVTDEDFARCFDLRWRILRAPWDQPRGSERDAIEHRCWHRMACMDDRIPIGVARLQRNSSEQGQIRYMAVEPAWRGHGAGRALVDALEAQARTLGLNEIVLDAREESVAFYQRLGFAVVGPSHTLFGTIHHSAMRKRL
jgi:N-acetylglutamate synthase-like GNAT family acetyltransferase